MPTAEFFFKPGQGELIHTTVKLSEDGRCAVLGRVLSNDGKPVKEALAMLFNDPDSQIPSAQTFTDERGAFLFGPLESGRLHLIKIYKDGVRIRKLELFPEQN